MNGSILGCSAEVHETGPPANWKQSRALRSVCAWLRIGDARHNLAQQLRWVVPPVKLSTKLRQGRSESVYQMERLRVPNGTGLLALAPCTAAGDDETERF